MEYVKIEDRTFKFSLLIIDVYKFLINKQEYIMAKQLLRCGTSIGANVAEAQAAQSKRDFIAKMSIASKEARETKYWLRLLQRSNYLENSESHNELLEEIDNVINIITKIVKTSQENINK